MSPAVIAAVLAYVEGDVFRGSRHMLLDDALAVLTEHAVSTMPGLPSGPGVHLRRALREAKQLVARRGVRADGADDSELVSRSGRRLPPIAAASQRPQRIIGTGSSGEVVLSWWAGGPIDVAVKANGVQCKNAAAIDNEAALLERLLLRPHKHILVVYGIVTDAPDGGVRLVMAHCAGGSLDGYLNRARQLEGVRARTHVVVDPGTRAVLPA